MEINLSYFDHDFCLMQVVAFLCPPENILMFAWGIEREVWTNIG